MKNLLSVGEVCKLKGISVGSLRYYEKMGLLIPAYINPQSNYRYYSHKQFYIIDIILICIDLDIPLKDAKSFFKSDEKIDISAIHKLGEEIAHKKISKIQSHLRMINNLSKHLEDTERILNSEKTYIKNLNNRHILYVKYDFENFSIAKYETLYISLKDKLLDFPNTNIIDEGFMIATKNGIKTCNVFIELEHEIENLTCLIHENIFKCNVIKDFPVSFNKIISETSSDLFFCRWLLEPTIDLNQQLFEMQYI